MEQILRHTLSKISNWSPYIFMLVLKGRFGYTKFMLMSPGAKGGSQGFAGLAPCICLEMRLGERTRLIKFGELDSR